MAAMPFRCRLIALLRLDSRPDLWAVVLLAAICACVYGRFVLTDKFAGGGDFATAVSYTLNFKAAVDDGQWVPRWLVVARELLVGVGSLDGTRPLPGGPALQYYGFLTGALAYPLLALGVPTLRAMQLLTIFAMTGAAGSLYAAGRIVGARPAVAFLAAFGYLVTPWLVSNYYGRGGIAEALGQALLPVLVLGYALLVTGRYRAGIVTVALGMFALGLAHNIFFLNGAVLCTVLGAASVRLVRGESGAATRWRLDVRVPAAMAVGVALGIAVAGWQWVPAWMTGRETYHPAGTYGAVPMAYADLSGAWGFPQRFIEPWSGTTREFFFTLGWWTLPSVLLLVVCRRERRTAAVAVFAGFAVFFGLTYIPGVIYPYLPGFFGATQYTFRLLAFLSVLGSFALCLALPRLPRAAVVVLLVLIVGSQFHVLTFSMGPVYLPDEHYLNSYECGSLLAESPLGDDFRHWPDGALGGENLLHLGGREARKVYLSLSGTTWKGLKTTQLHFAPPGEPERPMSNTVTVEPGAFEATFTIDRPAGDLRLYSTEQMRDPNEKRMLSIRLKDVWLAWESPTATVRSCEMKALGGRGYRREFAVADPAADRCPDERGEFTVALPFAYSRFSVPYQGGRRLPSEVDFNHCLCVRTADLATPITVQYEAPTSALALTLAGVAGLALVLVPLPRFRTAARAALPQAPAVRAAA